MNNPLTPEEEALQEGRLSELFQTLTPPLEDEGFSDIVLRRIRRHLWVRRVVLGTAVVVGGVLALGPAVGREGRRYRTVLLSEALLTVAIRWNDPAWLAQNWAGLILALLAVAWPGAMRLLER